MNMKKQIAIVSDAVYPFNKGGKETRIDEISRRLAARGHDVTIYCMQWWRGGKTMEREGVKFYAVSPYRPLYAGKRRSMLQALVFALHCFKLLTKDFDIIEVDCVPHFQLFTAKIVCLLKRKRLYVSWHEVWGKSYWKSYLGPIGVLAWWVECMSSKMPDVFISVSPHTSAALRKTLGVTRKIVTIPNGLDVEAIVNVPRARKSSDIVYAGRLLAHKNIDILLRAVAILKKRLPRVKLLVIGDGPERARLAALARTLGVARNVSFAGFLEGKEDLYALMQASKLFAFPSTREGFGIAVIEANACGLPVVTVDHKQNAAKDLVLDGENGKVCTLDPEALAKAMAELLAKRRAPRAYVAHAARYRWENLMPKIHALYTT